MGVLAFDDSAQIHGAAAIDTGLSGIVTRGIPSVRGDGDGDPDPRDADAESTVGQARLHFPGIVSISPPEILAWVSGLSTSDSRLMLQIISCTLAQGVRQRAAGGPLPGEWVHRGDPGNLKSIPLCNTMYTQRKI